MKKFMLVLLMGGVITLTGCGSRTNQITSEASSSSNIETSVSSSEISKSTTSQSGTSTRTSDSYDQSDIDIVMDSLNQGFSEYFNVSYDSKNMAFILTPIEGLPETETLKKIASAPTEDAHEESLRINSTQLIELSTMISDNVGSGFTIVQANPLGGDNLFEIKDGVISYPILDK